MEISRYLAQAEKSWSKVLSKKGAADFSLNDPWPCFLEWMEDDVEACSFGVSVFVLRLFKFRTPPNYRFVPQDHREDVLHGVIQRCCEKISMFGKRDDNVFRYWVARVAVNFITSYDDRLNQYKPIDPEILEQIWGQHTPPKRVFTKNEIDVLTRCFQSLRSRCQTLFVAISIGFENREIAEQLGVSNKRAGNWVYECRMKMKDCLRKAGLEYEGF
jgi:RNA polymerase sigma factor (sigma-70 family)